MPIVPSGKVFKNWSADGIYDTPSDKFKEELFFTMPDRSNNYNMLTLRAEFAEESAAFISGDTKVLLAMGRTEYNGNDAIMHGTVGDSVDLFNNQYSEGVDYHTLRTISYQWWEGESVGANDEALHSWVTFDKSKTYTVKVTITAKGKFDNNAGVQFGVRDGFLKMKNVTRSTDGKTLTFVATPLWTMDLPLPTLYDGDNLSGIEKSMNGQLMPLGYITDVRWQSGTPSYAYTATTGTYYIEELLLKPYSSSTVNCPLVDNKVVIDGISYARKADSNGNLNVTNYYSTTLRLPIRVLPKGVSVSGTVKSWNATDDALYYLYPSTMEDADIKAEWKSDSYTGTACTSKGTPAASGNQFAQTFQFDAVTEGDYKLTIFKPGKYVPKIVPITVGSTDHDCGQPKLWLYGDVNYDGKVSVIDATQTQRYAAGKSSKFTEGTLQDIEDRKLAANVTEPKNHDNRIDVVDATQIQRYIAGKTSTFESMK